ncbi:PAS domain-containing sensor histidine kinase [Mucilaginibacter sp. dw_454]|uniref:PAS domain-containing sensor histidine kinase n=1 Tax=Mucilaginibacter sp. dw_454 TaxID=2720079 RepID=UPI001BD5AE49|nr:PAS domain-containing sensor histidine kinase [Mucilaginibacter sp. dw_454]
MTVRKDTPDDKFNLGLFFDLSADWLCIAGFDGYFKKINPAVCNLLGYTEEELFSRPINDFVYLEDKTNTAAGRHNLTAKNIPLLHFENRYVTKTGEIIWLSWTSVPVDSEQLVYAIAKNITHKKKLEEERNQIIKNLTGINDDLKQLNYTTSHDLRAPVTNLLSVFSLLDDIKQENSETLELINLLKAATQNLKHTLDKYVDALTEKATPNVSLEKVDLNKTLDTVLNSLRSLIAGSRTVIVVDFRELSQIWFNEAYLQSIFLNLITNSIKYARPGEAPHITISTQLVDGVDRLTFADKGIGFDMEKVKDKIFGFHQKFHDNTDSKGIGLYLIYNHITSLGGSISVKSEVNEGVEYSILFKRQEEYGQRN